MVSSTRIQVFSLAAAGTLVVLTAASVAARSSERPVRLGPVGADEPIMTTVGNRNVIAFYRPVDGHCNVYVVTCNRSDDSGAEQVRVSLSPLQIVHIDSADHHTVNLECTDNAMSLAVVNSDGRIATGTKTNHGNTQRGQVR
jgi:hypothetical protein